jgi:MTH538 TIR-like domain (DUF1863)
VQAELVSGDIKGSGFSAFISYSHTDAAMAAALQKKLERYRLPRKIAAAYNIGNTALGQIFRDQEDLAAAPSLSDAIQNALAHSQALIVICSPAAAVSQWVTQEIQLFRSLHAERPILAVLVHGEPATAFPELLTQGGIEPLAADWRKGGDGAQLAFLKIVAGIAGVPLDALIQRDAQRKLRRVTAITLGALLAMLIMGVMTTLALNARNEAAHQRAEAEGLVEYMLTDLREVLKGVGRPEAMSSVNERALKHYRNQGDLSRLPADSLERRARVMLAIGEDDERYGRLDQALAKFQESHRTTAALLANEPKNPDRIFAHAQSEYYVGYGAKLRNDWKMAAQHWNGYLTQARALAKAEPDTKRSLMELGYAHGNLCELELDTEQNFQVAEGQCRAAVNFEEKAYKISGKEPKVAQDLANRYGWLADVFYHSGNLLSAITCRQREKALLDSLLAADTKNVEYTLRRSWADIGLATYYFEMKQPDRVSIILTPYLKGELFRMDKADNRVAETKLRMVLYLAKAKQSSGLDPARYLAIANRLDDDMPAIHPNWSERSQKIRNSILTMGGK